MEWDLRQKLGKILGHLPGLRWSSTEVTTTESVPARTVYKGRAAACQCQSVCCSSDGVTESLYYFGLLELQLSP